MPESVSDTEWGEALGRLSIAEEIYSRIGIAGRPYYWHVIRPLRDRVNRGERSAELIADINDITL
jgi:hypothetical protein